MKVIPWPNSPYLYYRFTVAGKEYRGSTGKTNKAEALMVAAARRAQIVEELKQRSAGTVDITLKDMLDGYWAAHGSRQKDAYNVRILINKLLGNMERKVKGADGKFKRNPDGSFVLLKCAGLNPAQLVHQLTKQEVARLWDTRLAEGNAVGTANREISRLQGALSWARSRGYRVPDWREDFKTIKGNEKATAKMRHMTEEEEDALLRALDPQGDPRKVDQYHLVLMALDLGCRYSEIAKLWWEDIDLDRGTVLVQRGKVGNKSTLYLTDRLQGMLEARFTERNIGCPFVFPGRGTDKPRGYSTKGIRKALLRAGINDAANVEHKGKATFHSTRDTHATRIVQGGGSLFEVQQVLGHATPQMSQKYAHLKVEEASARVVQILNQKRIKQ